MGGKDAPVRTYAPTKPRALGMRVLMALAAALKPFCTRRVSRTFLIAHTVAIAIKSAIKAIALRMQSPMMAASLTGAGCSSGWNCAALLISSRCAALIYNYYTTDNCNQQRLNNQYYLDFDCNVIYTTYITVAESRVL